MREIMKENFAGFHAVCQAKVADLEQKVYDEGLKEHTDNMNYWKGKADGIRFAYEFGDDFIYCKVSAILKEAGYKDAANYLQTLIGE